MATNATIGTDLTVQEATDNLVCYEEALTESNGNVGEIRDDLADVKDDLLVFQRAIEKVENLRDEVSSFGDDLGKLQLVFRLLGRAPEPLKTLSKSGSVALSKIEDFVKRVEDKIDEVADALIKSPVNQTLNKAIGKVEDFDSTLATVQEEISQQQAAFSQVLGVIAKTATVGGATTDAAIQASGAVVSAPLAVINEINDKYDEARALLSSFGGDVPDADFQPLIDVDLAINKITGSLDFIRKPLNEVYRLLSPLEPLLDAVDTVSKFTIDPVLNFISKNIGVDDLINTFADKIDDLLPRIEVLDGFEAAYEKAREALDGSFGEGVGEDPFNIIEWAETKLETELMQVAGELIGNVSAGGAGIAIELPEGTKYADGDNDLYAGVLDEFEIFDLILVGDRNDNTITATGGENLLIGGEGNDYLKGAAGVDTAAFVGRINEYTFSRDNKDSPVLIEHISPVPGFAGLDGKDTLENIEFVSFRDQRNDPIDIDALFDQLETAAPGKGIDRSADTETTFLIAQRTTLPAPEGVTLEGGSGDDLISGEAGDDLMIGNAGDDKFSDVGGNNTIFGGSGRDVFSFFDDGQGGGSSVDVDLEEGEFRINSTPDVTVALFGVEDINVEDQRHVFGFGNAQDNRLTSSGKKDLLDGRAGDDVLDGGGDHDILIGGLGRDTIFGGDGDDVLIVADTAADFSGDPASFAQLYDGGEGIDTVSYSNHLDELLKPDYISENGFSPDLLAENQIASNAVTIFGGEGRIERAMSDGGIVVDEAVGVESYTGSIEDDTLYGGIDGFYVVNLDGDAGDDIIEVEHAKGNIYGGSGDDTVIAGFQATAPKLERIADGYFGGVGTDTLDLSGPEELRWSVIFTASSNAGNIAAGYDGVEAFEAGSGTVDEFELFLGGVNDDTFTLAGDRKSMTVFAGAGDDTITTLNFNNNASYVVHGEAGDDAFDLRQTTRAFGGLGNDTFQINMNDKRQTVSVDAGKGNDVVSVLQAKAFEAGSLIDGGAGIDILSAFTGAISPKGGVRIDLLAGRMTQLSGGDVIDLDVVNFEAAIGSDLHSDILSGGAGEERLIGGGGNDLLEGRTGSSLDGFSTAASGDDLLYGGAGFDTLFGGDGDDLLHGGDSNDLLHGGLGNDTASFANSAPGVRQGAQSNTRFFAVNADLMRGTAISGPATDTLISIENLIGTSFDDVLSGDAKDNVLQGGAGADTLDGREGDDVLVLEGDDIAIGGDGNDTFVLNAGNFTIIGGDNTAGGRGDVLDLSGVNGSVTLDLAAGTYTATVNVETAVWADTMTTELRSGFSADDVLEMDPAFANSDDDLTRVLPDNDTAYETTFVRELETFSGTITGIETVVASVGGYGNDAYEGTDVDDDIIDIGGTNSINGGNGADRIKLLSGSNDIDGGAGNDLIIGGYDNDVLSGGAGRDTIVGDASTFIGGADQITGGKGDDLLEGGVGADTFVFNTGDGSDTIGAIAVDVATPVASTTTGADFVSSIDKIALNDFGFSDGADAFARVSDVNGVATFDDQGTTITFVGLTTADLTSDDFQIL